MTHLESFGDVSVSHMPLRKLARVRMGKTILSKELGTSGVPVYSAGASDEPWGYIEQSDLLFGEETLVVSARGNIGKPKLPRQHPFVCTQTTIAISLVDVSLRKYVHYFLQSIDFSKFTSQTTIPMIRVSDVNKIEVPLPGPQVRDRIVAEIEKQFSRLDEAVANLKRVKANLKRYKAAVLKAAVEGRLVPTEAELAYREGREYETGAQLLRRIRDTRLSRSPGKVTRRSPAVQVATALGELPAGWVWTYVGEAFEVHVGATPSRSNAEYWNGVIPWVSSGEVAFCRIRKTRESISASGLANSSTTLHPPGTVLLGMIGEGKTRGQAAILDIEACNNQNSAAIRVADTDVLPEYVYLYLEKVYEDTRRRGSGGNQPALNKERVRAIPIALPPIDEQRRIVNETDRLLSTADTMESLVLTQTAKADALKHSVLATKLLS